MTIRGYALVELLLASTLISLVSVGIYSGFTKSIDIAERIHETRQIYAPLKELYMRCGKDLRNTVPVRDHRFSGNQDEMTFVSALSSDLLSQIRYHFENGELVREESALCNTFTQSQIRKRVLLRNVERLKFEYSYLDEDDGLSFPSIWIEEPYFGIPRAIRIEIKLKHSKQTHLRLITAPQGRFARAALI